MTPWPPRTTPARSGCAATRSRRRRPRSKPGRCQSSQPSRPPKASATRSRPVGGGREGDQRVGMEMVDVRGREKSVQRRVDRRHRAARPEAGVVEQGDHVVLVVEALVDALHRAQPLEVDQREPRRPSACRGRRRSPSRRARVAARPVIGSSSSTLAEVLPPPKFVTRGSDAEAARPLDERDDLRVLERATRHTRWSCRGCRRLQTCRAASAGGRSERRTRPCRQTGRRAAARPRTAARGPSAGRGACAARRRVTSTGPTGSRSSKKKVRRTTAG